MGDINLDKLNEQFIEYQLFYDDDIPDDVKDMCQFGSDLPKHVDILWGYLGSMNKPGTAIYHSLIFC